ncbi:hypothetical protein LCGC14_1548460 [marine sediment metagenome]|uniref:Uncharacterized protein n=1 Tax=marine sediment metagenome TaxID=412755 RepID=A0A0F9IR37_9ZZZZ
MLQRIHNILAWITINNSTELSIYALKLQTMLTNRWPHLNPPTDLGFSASVYEDCVGAYSPTLVNGEPIK